MNNKYKLIVDSFGKERFKFDEPLVEQTALRAGGPARLFFIAFSVPELIKIINMCRQLKLPFFLFGMGTKIMFSDLGFDGLVIKNRTKDIEIVSIKGKVSKLGIGIDEALVEVNSGVSVARFMEFLDAKGLTSSEFKNIPGTMGGNLFLSNILQNRIKSIKILTLGSQIEEIQSSKLSLNKHIVLSAVFRIKAK